MELQRLKLQRLLQLPALLDHLRRHARGQLAEQTAQLTGARGDLESERTTLAKSRQRAEADAARYARQLDEQDPSQQYINTGNINAPLAAQLAHMTSYVDVRIGQTSCATYRSTDWVEATR